MKLCTMHKIQSNSSTCDDESMRDTDHTHILTPQSTVTVDNCDMSDDLTHDTSCSTIVSPPASPVDSVKDDILNICHSGKHQIRSTSELIQENLKPFTTSCTHCATVAASSPLSDVTNKRLSAAREIISVIRKGKFDEFISILSSKPNVDVNTFVNGNTALHYCLLFGRDVSWCKQLVSKGANPNLSNMDGWHPIHLAAAYCQQPEMLAYLARCNTRQIV